MTAGKLSTNPGFFSNNNIDTLIVALMIIYSGSLYYSTFYFQSLTPNFYLIPLLIILFIISINRGVTYSRINILFLFLTLVIIVKGSDVDYLKTPAIYCALLLSAFLIVSIISFEQFSQKYLRIILILSVLSWLAIPFTYFRIYSILPNFFDLYVVSRSSMYENYIFFAVPTYNIDNVSTAGISVLRSNGGIFWEPGAWAIFVNTGFILGMANRLITYRRYLIILITNLTIASTTGLIVFLLLSIAHLGLNSILNKKKIMTYSTLVLAIIFVLSNNFFSRSVAMVNIDTQDHLSFISRLNDNMLDWNIFLENPLKGIGTGNLAARQFYSDKTGIDQGAGSDGIIKFISEVGMLGFAIIIPLLFPRYLIKYTMMQRLIIYFSFFLMFNTQGMMLYLLPWVITFYGLKGLKSCRENISPSLPVRVTHVLQKIQGI